MSKAHLEEDVASGPSSACVQPVCVHMLVQAKEIREIINKSCVQGQEERVLILKSTWEWRVGPFVELFK